MFTSLTVVVLGLLGLFSIVKKTPLSYYLEVAHAFLFAPQNQIKSNDDRTNILILGRGGQGHDAPDLTDTMMLASVHHESGGVTFVSIPRDIWHKPLRIKLNSAYYWGNKKQNGGGLVLAKSVVEEIVGVPVHYAVVVDFTLFKDVVDELGGVQVDVENSFEDIKYPIAGREVDDCGGGDPEFLCRYETIKFESGLQFMDGETALKFVRSRNAEGDEGTDLARSSRQQRVILAVKNRLLSRYVLLSLSKLSNIKELALSRIETDMAALVTVVVARKFIDARDNFRTTSIPEELIQVAPISSEYDNLYVFIPRANDWSQIQNWVRENL